jgi:outer membrane receptor protein involved in Fe transport
MKSILYLFGLLGINLLPLIAGQPILASPSCLPFPARTIPRQVTVIEREELAQPTARSRQLEDILRQRVPSVSPIGGKLSLRGRPASFRIDGVPVENGDAILRGLTPEMVERIEVIPSPTPWCAN